MLYDVYYSENSVRCGLGVRGTRARMKKKKKLKHNSFQLTNKLTNKQVRVLYNYISIVQFVVCVRASERAFSWWWNHDDDDVCAFESARFIGTQHSTHITIWLVCIFAPFDWVNVARCVSQMTFIRMDSFVSFSVRVFSTLVFKAHCAHTFVHIYCHIFSLSLSIFLSRRSRSLPHP